MGNPWPFWAGCVPTRIAIAVLVSRTVLRPSTNKFVLWAFAAFAAAVAVGLGTLAVFPGLRPVAPEAALSSASGRDGRVWWASLRPVHAVLWGATAVLLVLVGLNRVTTAKAARIVGTLQAADVTIGVLAVVWHHHRSVLSTS